MALKRLGQILIDLGLIDEMQLATMLEEQSLRGGELIGKVGVALGYYTDEQLGEALAEQWGTTFVTLYDRHIPPEVARLLSEPMAQLYRVIPLALAGNRLTIASAEPQKIQIADELRTFLGYDIHVCVATEPEITKAIGKLYSSETESVESLVEDLEHDEELAAAAAAAGREGPTELTSVEALAESAPVRKLLNMVLLLAIRDGASDIHFEPFEDEFRIRLKADGVLQEMVPPPKHLAFAITTRIKVMANLDIAERRLPQDGRIKLRMMGKEIDLRVSTLPTLYGESVVLRILDRGSIVLDLGSLGFPSDTLADWDGLIVKPYGMILVTGPTGSGKTTTLYGSLNKVNSPDKKIITIEDPVEYQLNGVNQIHVKPQIGLTFANGLRSIVRQDPDVIMVGEIRDAETAEIAIQAALTGHLVFSTLHTNDAAGAVARLLEMGVEDYLLASSLLGVLAQRLVRRNCSKCLRPIEGMIGDLLPEADKGTGSAGNPIERGIAESLAGAQLVEGAGCEACSFTGYRGRAGIYELLLVDDAIRNLILKRSSADKIREEAIRLGMRTLREDGWRSVREGMTTVSEVIRVSRD